MAHGRAVDGRSPAGPPTQAWLASVTDFYRAGRIENPTYPPLVASFVPGSPALAHTVAFLTALAHAGVEAPSDYRLGHARLLRESGADAVVEGCAYDTGAVYATSGRPAPAALGGGPGYTAFVAVLHDVHGRWLVWSDRTVAPASDRQAGPCHGF